MGVNWYWIDPDHREVLEVGGTTMGWKAQGPKKPFSEVADVALLDEMSGVCGVIPPGFRVRTVRLSDVEDAQVECAEQEDDSLEAENILYADVWPWKGGVSWFEAKDRKNVYRTMDGGVDEPRIYLVDSDTVGTGVRDIDPRMASSRLGVKKGWTVYTIYRGGPPSGRGTQEEFERHGYRVWAYGGDPAYFPLDGLEKPDKNVPDDLSDVLTK